MVVNCSQYGEGNSSLVQLCLELVGQVNQTREQLNETREQLGQVNQTALELAGKLVDVTGSTGWIARDINVMFLLWAGALVFSMHLGFGMVRGQRWVCL
jgi:hypothetical protein